MQAICAGCSEFSLASAISPIRIWVRQGLPPATQSIPEPPAQTLHVYIENDGAPFLHTSTKVAVNPSLQAGVLALQLMQLDPHTSLYLSRPCYGFGFKELPTTCHPRYWTNARYSAEVVGILSHALDEAKNHLNKSSVKIVLIGHSGGGSLALLVAQRRDDVDAVITLAGNLDTDAWTKLHGNSPLDESLNPFTQPLLPPQIKRWHFAGANDTNIPPFLMQPSCQQDALAQCQIINGVAHQKGWLQHWPALLSQMHL